VESSHQVVAEAVAALALIVVMTLDEAMLGLATTVSVMVTAATALILRTVVIIV